MADDTAATQPGCLYCGSENIRPEFERNGDRRDMVRLVCDDCGAKGKRRGD